MVDSARKSEILEKEGFVYHFSRMIYINSKKRKIFSEEAVDDNSVDYLIEKIREASIPGNWQLYFSGTSSDEIKRDILSEIAPSFVREPKKMVREIRHRLREEYLREEYFRLLPDIRKILEEMEAKINYALVSIKKKLKNHERIEIQSRVKDCESAINAFLRMKREEGRKNFLGLDEEYSLLELKDLAGIRVLVFPKRLMKKVDKQILNIFRDWNYDPITRDDPSEIIVDKYFGYIDPKIKIYGEYQIVPMLVGLFWHVEHAVLYKPEPELKFITSKLSFRQKREAIYDAFDEFEKGFEDLIAEAKNKAEIKT